MQVDRQAGERKHWLISAGVLKGGHRWPEDGRRSCGGDFGEALGNGMVVKELGRIFQGFPFLAPGEEELG